MRGNNRFKNPWTDEEEEIIRKNYLKGDRYLYSLLPNRTIPSIKQHRLGVLKLKNNHYSKRNKIWMENKKKIIEDYINGGLKIREICSKYGIGNQTLRSYLYNNGIRKK